MRRKDDFAIPNFQVFTAIKKSVKDFDFDLQKIEMMTEENYLLKWNDFEKNLSDGLKALKLNNTFCDVTLLCEDSQLEAHRVVLSVSSNFFQNILTKNSHSHPLLYLKGVKMSDMESIVHFLYHGEANVALEDLEVMMEYNYVKFL